jgi:hypothetical protein
VNGASETKFVEWSTPEDIRRAEQGLNSQEPDDSRTPLNADAKRDTMSFTPFQDGDTYATYCNLLTKSWEKSSLLRTITH